MVYLFLVTQFLFLGGFLDPLLEPNIVKHQSDYQILILGIVW